MPERKTNTHSIDDYLKLEAQSSIKSEYEHGRIIAMSGDTLNHGIIGNNINTALNLGLRNGEKSCIPINGDVRIWIEQANSFVYPDAMVICGKPETYKKDANSILNPVLVVKVLSKSTESYDRGDKFHKYCSLPSFKEYVLIDQNKPVIDTLYKEDRNYWKMTTTIGLENAIYLHTINLSIALSDIYRNTQKLGNPQFKLDF